MTRSIRYLLAVCGVALLSQPALAQNQSLSLSLPLASQRAVVSQRVGITDITITYHRPLVGGRTIWGGIVPYGEVWRAGANENTVVEFSDPVTVEGRPLDRGSYGLHMIPGQDTWTVIFSKNYTSWGSFSYDKAEDALRVDVKAVPSDAHEALTYEFADPKVDSVVMSLKWEKLAVPIRVATDTKTLTVASIRNQLRTVPGFTWQGYDDAAQYCLEQKSNYEDALKWVETSIQNEERFENLMTKSRVLTALGREADAKTAKDRAITIASVFQLHTYARLQIQQGNAAEAVKLFKMNADRHPEAWVTHVGLARVASSEGNFQAAAKEVRTALAAAPEPQKNQLNGLLKRLDAGQDINK
jgi:tetratricopeptide (TPR) repeat protein